MSNARKSFTVALAEHADEGRGPLEFDLSTADGSVTEVFAARPWQVPIASLMRVSNMMIDQNTAAMFRVFRSALIDPSVKLGADATDAEVAEAQLGDWPRFEEFIEDPRYRIDAEALAEIIQWFIEEHTGHPRKPSPSSPRGSRRTST